MLKHERPTYDELEQALLGRDKRIRELLQEIEDLRRRLE
jgi:hypothetical protein